MRIAFDHQIFCAQAFGGISRYFARLAERLNQSNITPRIFAPLHRNHYLYGLAAGIVHGHGRSNFPPRTGRPVRLLNRILARRAIRTFRPDIVHETYYCRTSVAPPDCAVVLTVYDMIHERMAAHFSSSDQTSRIKHMAVERADHIICISESTKHDLLEIFNVTPQKVSVVHLGFDNLYAPHPPEPIYSSPSRPFLLFVGGRERYKNFYGLLQAYSRSTRLYNDFDIVAFGGSKLSAAEKTNASRLGIAPSRLHHIGGDDRRLQSLYATATALIYPSLYEGFGLPPLEAMAYDCPVISSNTSSLPEVIGRAGEYFDPYCPDAMASAIEHVVYSPARVKQLKELGRHRIERFSWSQCADNTLAIYRSLTG